MILYMVDAIETSREELEKSLDAFRMKIAGTNKKLILVANKMDRANGQANNIRVKFSELGDVVFISAREQKNLAELKEKLFTIVQENEFSNEEVIVTNARHYESLRRAYLAISEVEHGMDQNISGELLATDIRKTLHHLGEITGDITTDDLLGNIFAKFCIGK